MGIHQILYLVPGITQILYKETSIFFSGADFYCYLKRGFKLIDYIQSNNVGVSTYCCMVKNFGDFKLKFFLIHFLSV